MWKTYLTEQEVKLLAGGVWARASLEKAPRSFDLVVEVLRTLAKKKYKFKHIVHEPVTNSFLVPRLEIPNADKEYCVKVMDGIMKWDKKMMATFREECDAELVKYGLAPESVKTAPKPPPAEPDGGPAQEASTVPTKPLPPDYINKLEKLPERTKRKYTKREPSS